MAKSARPSPDELIAGYPPGVRDLANEIRRTLLAAVPSFEERALPGWRAIAFRDPQAGHVCALFPFEDYVRLYVEYGASLPDPAGLFNASLDGNVRRAIDVHEGDTLDEKALKALIRAAVALNTSSARK